VCEGARMPHERPNESAALRGFRVREPGVQTTLKCALSHHVRCVWKTRNVRCAVLFRVLDLPVF